MKEMILIDKNDFEEIHRTVLERVKKDYVNKKIVRVSMTMDDYAQWTAFKYYRQLDQFKKTA